MKKTTSILVTLLLGASILTGCQNSILTEKTTIEEHPLHPEYTIETLVQASETIVHGIVIDQGDTFVHKTITTSGREIESVFTPMTIEVTDCLKGTAENVVIYNQRGGETDTTIYEVNDGGKVSIGDEVLIFLNEVGVTWGGQGVYIIDNGYTAIDSRMLSYTALANETENQLFEMSLIDLESLVSEYIDQ